MLFKTQGIVHVLKRGSFKSDSGEQVDSLTLYDPDSCQTLQFYGPACGLVGVDILPMSRLIIEIEWRYSKAKGWRPRLVSAVEE